MTDRSALRDLADGLESGAIGIATGLQVAEHIIWPQGSLDDPPGWAEFHRLRGQRAWLSAVQALEGDEGWGADRIEKYIGKNIQIAVALYRGRTIARCTGPDAEARSRLAALARLIAEEG